MRVLGDEPDDAPAVLAGEVRDLHPVERHRPLRVGEEPQQHAGERRLPRAAGADDGDAPAGDEVEVESVERPAALPWVAGAQPSHRQRVLPAGVRPAGEHPAGERDRVRRLGDGWRGVEDLLDARGRAAHPLQRLGRGGQAGDELEGDQRDQGDPGEQHPVEAPRADRRDADEQSAPHRQAGGEARKPLADAGRARARAGDPGEGRVGRQRASQLLLGGAVHEQLGRALEQVDDRRGERTACLSLPGLRARGEQAGQPRDEHAGEQQRDEQDQTGGRQHPPDQADGDGADERRDRERGQHPQQQVLERVDVVDEPREQIAAAEERHAERGEPLEPLVDPDA